MPGKPGQRRWGHPQVRLQTGRPARQAEDNFQWPQPKGVPSFPFPATSGLFVFCGLAALSAPACAPQRLGKD